MVTLTISGVTPTLASIAANPSLNEVTSNVETSPATVICMLTTVRVVAPEGIGGGCVIVGGDGDGDGDGSGGLGDADGGGGDEMGGGGDE